MKEQILELLKSDSLQGYFSGIDLFLDSYRNNSLTSADLDHEMIERTCAVFLIERWAEHEDWNAALDKFMEVLPGYSEYLSHEDVGHHLRGLAIFIDGIYGGEIDLSGFIYPSGNVYINAQTAAQSLKEFFKEQNDEASAGLFEEIEAFFDSIASGQFGAARILTELRDWSVEMAQGFYVVMSRTEYNRVWMLRSLYKVVDSPIIREHVFEKFLNVLRSMRVQYEENGENEKLEQMDEFIETVVAASKGD
ncbi:MULTISPECIES: hypothetical protein [unclassified Flavobacterium]|uniref:hypothetical protein n=1 Tax=unclassified Flavobacterium TaxID=196869 RepID=UPI00095F0BA3|nr:MULTISPECIES: hypothetical protein [unclassified Flavobacterium]MBN9283181.1 hypothetical protein [Flavobacterium sp.]OJV67807.1 MAG: hypothetical protein BGO42_17445 [Flavobacterium sp. 40-81]